MPPHICPLCNKRPAVLHITELPHPDEGGEPAFLHICEQCARKRGILAPPQVSLKDLLESAMAQAIEANEDETGETPSVTLEVEPLEDDESERRCPECGVTFPEIRRRGRFGCPHDYDFFREELAPLLKRIHGDVRHTGKTPPGLGERLRHEHKLAELKKEMDALVEREDYEGAARARDRLRELEGHVPNRTEDRPGPFIFQDAEASASSAGSAPTESPSDAPRGNPAAGPGGEEREGE